MFSKNGDELATQLPYSVPGSVLPIEEGRNPPIPLLLEHGEPQPVALPLAEETYFHHVGVVELITHQAHTTPDAFALIMDEQVLTYAELNWRANQVAHRLRSLGVGPEVLVGCCIERSPDMVVGLLGILKAGGAYLPLNPADPLEWLSFMLTDSDTAIVLTQRKFLPFFTSLPVSTICIDRYGEEPALRPVSDVMPSTVASNLAYVIYTSGSAGQPKGVEITHAGLLNLICWHQDCFAISQQDRVTQLSNPAFDAAGWEIWPNLARGARIYFLAESVRISPVLLRDWLVSQRITVTFLPTALAEYMLELQWPPSTVLRLLLTGADTLHHYPAAHLPFALVNNYGPTEATVVTSSAYIEPSGDNGLPPSIGLPIANMQVYILDEQLQEVPGGTPGELYIGGVGLARGYRNRPDLTREKFIVHSFDAEPAVRLYKTGDLARYLPDGRIAFMGRIDRQVKICGFRIELSEIETVLHRYPPLLQAVVAVHEDVPGDKHLIAYIVMKQQPAGVGPAGERNTKQAASITHELRRFLSVYLPAYMLPGAFVVLDALPLTVNGKVDHVALSALAVTVPAIKAESDALSLEARVADIVANLLAIQHINRDENIFLLGGHSLLGTQILAQIAKTFGVRLPLRALFNAPTVKLLSGEVERHLALR